LREGAFSFVGGAVLGVGCRWASTPAERIRNLFGSDAMPGCMGGKKILHRAFSQVICGGGI